MSVDSTIQTDTSAKIAQLESRLSALERGIDSPLRSGWSQWESCVSLALGVGAIYCSFRGTGLPNHPYQIALGVILTAMLYHSRRLVFPSKAWEWILPVLNVALIVFLSKLLIGGGVRHPFFWMQYPSVQMSSVEERWFSVLPKAQVIWQASDLASWTLDLTVVQSFLAVISAFAAIVRFQPFASLATLMLVFFSIPVLMEFEWRWVFPALVLTGGAFYLQFGRRANFE